MRFLLLAIVALSGCSASKTVAPSPLPAFEITTTQGDTISSSNLPARFTVVNFWATWCLPCIDELQMLQNLEDTLGADTLKVIAVSVDRDPELLQSFLAAHDELTLAIASDPKGVLQKSFDIYSVPVTVFIDEDGQPLMVPDLNGGEQKSRFIGIRKWDHPESVNFFRQRLEN